MRRAHDFFLEQTDRCDPEVMMPYDIACVLQDIFQEYLQLPRVECPSCRGDGQHKGAPRWTPCLRCKGMGELIDD